MTKWEERKQRLLGILDYDEIEPCKRLHHLMQRCGLSRYMAKRALDGSLPYSGSTAMDMADALDVSIAWLWDGALESVHPRTFRIHWYVLNYSKQDINNMSRLMMALIAGQNKARNLADLIVEEKLSFPAAARLM